MRIISIGTDRKVFEEGTAVLSRQIKYAELLGHLDIIVSSLRGLGLQSKNYGSNLTAYPTNSLSRFLYFLDAFMIARKLERPDMVSSQDSFESGLAAYLISSYFRVPLHLQMHTDFLSPYFFRDGWLNKVRFYIAKFLIKRAKRIRVVSERIKRSIVSAGLKDSNVIDVLPVFVDIEKIRNSPIQTDLNKKYPQFERIILMASRITREKNIGLAIEAMVGIVQKYPKVGLVIVGDGPERENLELRIKNLELDKSVIIEGWNNNLVSYYKTADLFLLTSDYEGYGMTIVEALAAGLPVVMSDVGCAGDLVKNGINGMIFTVRDRDQLFWSLDKLLRDRQFLDGIKFNVKEFSGIQAEELFLNRYIAGWSECLEK